MTRANESPHLSILIAEPQEIIRIGLSTMASSIACVANVFPCPDPGDAKELLASNEIDIILVSSAYDARAIEELRTEAVRQHIKCLVIISEYGGSVCSEILELGMHGYVELNRLTTASLADSLNRILAGQTVLPLDLLHRILARKTPESRPGASAFPALTPREQQVLDLLAEGMINKQIARKISISEHGVKRHVANILAKLNAPNRTQAVSYALQSGILKDVSG